MDDLELPTAAEVRAIYSTTLTDEELEAFIEDAALLVGPCIEGLDADRQKAILKYVTADLLVGAASRGRGVATSKAVGDASESYNAGGATFGESAYWQRAIQYDPNGCLRRLGKPRATFEKL